VGRGRCWSALPALWNLRHQLGRAPRDQLLAPLQGDLHAPGGLADEGISGLVGGCNRRRAKESTMSSIATPAEATEAAAYP
jgi:hypothetical protein